MKQEPQYLTSTSKVLSRDTEGEKKTKYRIGHQRNFVQVQSGLITFKRNKKFKIKKKHTQKSVKKCLLKKRCVS